MTDMNQTSQIPKRTIHDLAGTREHAANVPKPKSRWAVRVLTPAVIVLAVLALLIYASWDRLVPAAPVRVVPVVMKLVQGTEVGSVTVQAPGWLEPDPHPYYASALADGIVEEILVLEGEQVEAGQVIAHLVDDDARLALTQAVATLEWRRADLDAAKADLRAAETTIEHLIEPRRVVTTTEAKLVEISAELSKLNADLLAEQAKLAEIQDELSRKARIVDTRAVSEATVRRLELRVDAQKASIQASEARRDVLRAQRQQTEADLDAAKQSLELLIDERQQLELAQSNVRQMEAAVHLAEAKRDEVQLWLDRTLVRAPVDGTVMVRLASPGSKLMREGPEYALHVVHIYDPQKLQVRVDVPLADAANVGVGQMAEVIVEVLPNHVFRGEVTRVVHQADIAKNTVEVKVAINDPVPQLKPEMLARVRFLAVIETTNDEDALRQHVFAPTNLLIKTGENAAQTLVVGKLVHDRGRVEQRSLILGQTQIDGWHEVLDGLRPGDLLLDNPPAGIEAGDNVRVLGESKLQPGMGGL